MKRTMIDPSQLELEEKVVIYQTCYQSSKRWT